MDVLAPFQNKLTLAGAELSRLSGFTAFQKGKEMLDQGGGNAELVVLAKRMAVDATSADGALAEAVGPIIELYEEAMRLCREAAAAAKTDASIGADGATLGRLSAMYEERAMAYHQVRDFLGGAAPPAPEMSSEEWHAARVLLPVRSAKAKLGLGRPVAGSATSVPTSGAGPDAGAATDGCTTLARGKENAAPATRVLKSVLCMDSQDDYCGLRKFASRREAAAAAAAVEAEKGPLAPSQKLWPMEDDEWDHFHFPHLFLKANGGGELPRAHSLHERAAALPPAEAPDQAPIVSAQIPGVSLAAVLQALQAGGVGSSGFLEGFYNAFSGASAFTTTEWTEEPRIPGTVVCGLRYTMPLPKDIPSAVARLVAVPETTRVTTTLRMRALGDEEAVVLLQTVAHDAPFGENFRTQEIIRFQPQSGGVRMTKWAAVVWIQSLAWHMAPVTKIIESKATEGVRSSADSMARMLGAAAAKFA